MLSKLYQYSWHWYMNNHEIFNLVLERKFADFLDNIICLQWLIFKKYSTNYQSWKQNIHSVINKIHVIRTVPETFFFPTWMVRERWGNGEWTVIEWGGSAEWKLSEHWAVSVNADGIWWGLGEWWAHAEHEQSTNASSKWTIKARWAQDEQFLRNNSGVILILYTD